MSSMTDKERVAARARLRKLIDSPAIRKSCGLDRKPRDPNDGDTRPENTKLPTAERVDAINKIFRSHK